MQSEGTVKQVVRWVALGALFLLTLTPLVVANTYFFPFITGKAFYLRILIEIAVVAWIVLALLDKEYRPRFSWIGAAVVGFVFWMFIANVFALNVEKAFWSNFERMEGWILLIHLLGLFFAASAVLRVEKKWRAWFLTSIGVSVVIIGYALLQLNGILDIHQGSTRIAATFGNSTYLAIYLLFSVFVALWLAQAEKYSWLKWSLIIIAAISAVLIFFTETRGAIIGLTLALTLAAFLTVITAGGRARRFAAGALALILLLAGSFYLARDSDFVQNNHILQRITSISLADGQTRFTVWNMAFQGVAERPLIGYGQEGFNYVFNKYYDPSLYEQEQWFDRAHNAFIDWLSAGGIPAFLLYLSLFGSAIVLLWRSSGLSRPERIALTAALVGYAVHNLFVFDNLYSYIYFFAILAFIDSQVSRKIERFENATELTNADGITYTLVTATVVLGALIWFVNVTGMQAASRLILAVSPSADPSKSIAIFEEFSQNPPFAMQEIREQLVSFASYVVQSQTATNEQKQRVTTLAIDELEKQVALYPLDARGHFQLSFAYRIAGDSANALKAIEAAILLSPKKVQFFIEKGIIEWGTGDVSAAQASFNTAHSLAPNFQTPALYAAAGNIAVGKEAAADKILNDTFGTTRVDDNILAAAYYHAKNWNRLIEIWESRVERPDASVETWFGLAAAYYASGDGINAIKTINEAIKRYPEAATPGAAAIKQIQEGKGKGK